MGTTPPPHDPFDRGEGDEFLFGAVPPGDLDRGEGDEFLFGAVPPGDDLPGGGPAGESPEWDLEVQRPILPEEGERCRIRILSPGPDDFHHREEKAFLTVLALCNADLEQRGDRIAIIGDPETLLAWRSRLPAGFALALQRSVRARRRRRWCWALGGGRRLRLGSPPAIFAVLNATPDSFSDGGKHLDPERALEAALRMAEEGADAIDLGGESTRPGSLPVPLEEEWRRVAPVLERVRGRLSIPISIDTTKAEVARRALAAGADIINDTSALLDDREMAEVARRAGAPVILMHRQGTPRDMQLDPRYSDATREVGEFLAARVKDLSQEGLDQEKMMIDPGIGFGKRVEHNLALLRDVDALRSLGLPVMVGASRKSFMGSLLDARPPGSPPDRPPEPGSGRETEADRRRESAALLVPTLAAHAIATLGGAAALRVHDVREHRQLLTLLRAIGLGQKPRPPSREGEAGREGESP